MAAATVAANGHDPIGTDHRGRRRTGAGVVGLIHRPTVSTTRAPTPDAVDSGSLQPGGLGDSRAPLNTAHEREMSEGPMTLSDADPLP